MTEPISIIASLAALAISSLTAWLTLFRRGTVHMTKPTVIFFGPDGGREDVRPPRPKVFLRFLVYSTGKRGQIVESMFVILRRGETRQTFNIWVYGDHQLVRGSGLFVGETGVVCNHHFLLPEEEKTFQFLAGEYQVDVFASLVGSSKTLRLSSVALGVSDAAGIQLQDEECGIYFDWSPDSKHYLPHIERKKVPHTAIFGLEGHR